MEVSKAEQATISTVTTSSELLVLNDQRGQRSVGHLLYQDTVGALCATDYKWVQQEQVEQGKLIIEVYMEYSIQKSGIYKASYQAHTLSARDYKDATDLITVYGGDDAPWAAAKELPSTEGGDAMTSVVRRLTPLE